MGSETVSAIVLYVTHLSSFFEENLLQLFPATVAQSVLRPTEVEEHVMNQIKNNYRAF